MTEITALVEWIQRIGFIGLITILAIPKARKFVFGNGNGNGAQEHRIRDLESHAEVANAEVGKIKDEIIIIREQVVATNTKMDILMKKFKL